MEDQVTRLVDKAWDAFMETPEDRRYSESDPRVARFEPRAALRHGVYLLRYGCHLVIDGRQLA